MNNRYDNTFKTNAVAVVRGGYGVRTLARRLGIPSSSIDYWLKDSRFSDVQPADPSLIMSLPPYGREQVETEVQPFVRIGCDGPAADRDITPRRICGVSVRCGRLSLEFHDGMSTEQLACLVRSLGDAHVL